MTTPTALTFASAGDDCAAWFWSGAGPAPARGRPVVVMAHGFGGTVDSGLSGFAEAFAAAGLHVLAFDYRGFGASGGAPRQLVSLPGQLADYRAALRTAAGLPGADPKRLVLWGESLSGGMVIRAAAGREDLAAVISLVPLVDGVAAARHAIRSVAPRSMALSAVFATAGTLNRVLGRPPVMFPLVAAPGAAGALTAPGYREDYLAMAGPTWRNVVSATIATDIAGFRPIRDARRMPAPWLVQIADFDRAAPPSGAARAAVRGRAHVRHYPCDHFDVSPGSPWHETAVAHQVAFLRR